MSEITAWKDAIEKYIDDLNDDEKVELYKAEILAKFYFGKVMSCIESSEEENIFKYKNILEKISTSGNTVDGIEKNIDKLKSIYSLFHENGWIDCVDNQVMAIKGKNNYYNIWVARSILLSAEVSPGVTHVAKLSHSSSTASSIRESVPDIDNKFLSTSSLINKRSDGSYTDAKYAKQVKFFMVELDGHLLFEEFLAGNYAPLSGFSDNDEEFIAWRNTIIKSLSPKLCSDSFIKQTYFPVDDDYHLLMTLKSSSMAQKIYDAGFSKDVRNQRDRLKKLKSASQFSNALSCYYPKSNRILTTSSQPQNSSVLNGKRGGAFRLFSAQPPTWQRQINPPIYQTSWFRSGIPNYAVKDDIEYLRAFLLRNEALALSTRDPKKRKWLKSWGEQIVDKVMYHANIIQTLPAGWSAVEDIKLKKAHQYFLDPFRNDEGFQSERDATEWETEIGIDFARWLNNHLKGTDKAFTPQEEHSKLWKNLMSAALRELTDTLKFSVEKEGRA